MILPPQGYKNISYKWLNQGMIFRPHGSYSGAIKLIAGLWSAQTYAVALTRGKDSLFCYSYSQRFLNVQNE